MDWARELGAGRARLALLALITLATGFVAMHPHLNVVTGERDPYPVHLDEYAHWGQTQEVMRTGDVAIGDPFSGEPILSHSIRWYLHERGFQAYLGAFQAVTGVAWLDVFRLGPALVAAFTAMTVFLLAERWGAGVEAAALTLCIPTTTRYLGPGFLVPLELALALLPVAIFLVLHGRPGALVAFGVVAAALWPIHVVIAGVVAIAALAFALARVRGSPRRMALVAGLALAPVMLAAPFYLYAFRHGIAPPVSIPVDLEVLRHFGLPVLALSAAGAAMWVMAGGERGAVGAVLGLLLAACLAAMLAQLAWGVDPLQSGDRLVDLGLFLATIFAGGAIAEARRRLVVRRVLPQRWERPALAAFSALALVLLTAPSVAGHYDERFYEVLDDETYAAYVLAAERLEPHHERALVDGPSTMAFTILTGRPTAFVQYPGRSTAPPSVEQFLSTGARDTAFLRELDVDVLVTWRKVENPDLVALGPAVYVVPEETST